MENRITNSINQILAKHSGSFYLYDRETIDRKAAALTAGFGAYHFLYSLKTNPFPDVVAHILAKGFGADAASAAEVALAGAQGTAPENIYYSAPGKTRADIEATMGRCTIIADSYGEIQLLNRIAAERGVHLNIGVRLNPDFSMFGDAGESGKFGIDEETLAENQDILAGCSSLSIVGIHVHLRSQILEEATLIRYYRRVFERAVHCKTQLGWDLSFLNFGGGLGIPYSTAGDKPLDVVSLGAACLKMMGQYPDLAGARLMIETGRYLVCECGWYVTPVVDCKLSRGTKYVIVQNGLNGFLRPAVAALLHNAAKGDLTGFAAEPLFTKMDAFDFQVLGKEDAPPEPVTVAGNLCTATDLLAVNVSLPRVEPGDHIVVSKAGSYAYSLTPLLFSSQPMPEQFLV